MFVVRADRRCRPAAELNRWAALQIGMPKTWFNNHPQRALVYGAAVSLVSAEIICVTAGSPPIWVLVTVVVIAACALTYVAWLRWGRLAFGRLVHPWADIPEVAHLAPKDRRAFWRYCREEGLAPLPSAEFLAAVWPSLSLGVVCVVGQIFYYSAPAQFAGLMFLAASAMPAVLLLQIAVFVRVYRRWVRRSISREVVAQFLGRQLPSALGTVRCPQCDYNLVAKTGDSTVCPECGTSIVECPQ